MIVLKKNGLQFHEQAAKYIGRVVSLDAGMKQILLNLGSQRRAHLVTAASSTPTLVSIVLKKCFDFLDRSCDIDMTTIVPVLTPVYDLYYTN